MNPQAVSGFVQQQESDDGYPALEELIRERISSATGPLFTTTADDVHSLFGVYLLGLPEDRRQHYNCVACRRFVQRYGGLVTIDDDGATHPLLWESTAESVGVPDFFFAAVKALFDRVRRSRVAGVFLSADAVWGWPLTPDAKRGVAWTHLSGTFPKPFKHALKTAEQMMAEKREDYGMLQRGLAEFPVAAVEQAVKVLQADAVDRSEKTLGVAEWLLKLHRAVADAKGYRRENIVWRAVATAPPGWCHIRTTMINTLLDDIVQGLPFDSIKRRWAEKMHPLQYQRPTAPPSDGAIQRAEKVVASLQSAGALERRFARLADAVSFWTPRPITPVAPQGNGVFGHLKQQPAGVQSLELPTVTMTWEKFARSVLPDALQVECQVPTGRSPFYGLVTAANADAPPILQWDGLEGSPRNPVSWYLYYHQDIFGVRTPGSMASEWNLPAGAWVKVPALCLMPPFWHRPDLFKHHAEGVMLVLDGARDLRHTQGGGFFPETLRSEYHEVRSVMEAYAQRAPIAGRDEGDANGLLLHKGAPWNVLLRVRTQDGSATYRLDRWD